MFLRKNIQALKYKFFSKVRNSLRIFFTEVHLRKYAHFSIDFGTRMEDFSPPQSRVQEEIISF